MSFWQQVQDEEERRYFEECQNKLKNDSDYEKWLNTLNSQMNNGYPITYDTKTTTEETKK